MSWGALRVHRSRDGSGDLVVRFGVALLDAYLEFLAVRSRPNTVVAVAYDLKVFFAVVGKQRPSHGVDPVGVRLVGEGLQRRGPQLRIGKTRSEDVQVARISKKAHQLEAYPRIAGVGVHGRADAVGILFDERLDLVHQ